MGTGQPFKPLIMFGLAGVLVLATVVVFTTRRQQMDIWTSTRHTTVSWSGRREITYRNVIIDWMWHYSGARKVVAPMRIYFTDPLSGEPDVDTIVQQLRREKRFRDGDEITCIQTFSPSKGRGTLPSYSASVLVRNRSARTVNTFLVQVDGHAIPF